MSTFANDTNLKPKLNFIKFWYLPVKNIIHLTLQGTVLKYFTVFHLIYNYTNVNLKVDSNEKWGWVEKENIIEIRSENVAIEGYLQFQRVIFVQKTYFRFLLIQLN